MTGAVRQLKVKVTGKVQHVGFRYFVRTAAKRLGITGWVKNDNDGSVQVLAEGESESLRVFIRSLQVGPSLARVENLDIAWTDPSLNSAEFEIH